MRPTFVAGTVCPPEHRSGRVATRLEIGTFPVQEAHFGERTRWTNGVLEIDRATLLALVRADHNVAFADVDLIRPGESVRIINVADVLEARVKVDGGGVAYPGICGRSVATVGRGRTHRLGGFAVVESFYDPRPPTEPSTPDQDGLPGAQTERRQAYIDMAGPGAVRPYAELINLVLTIEPVGGLDAQDRHLANHGAALRVADYLAEAVAELTPPEVEVFDLTVRDRSLPGVVFVPVLASGEAGLGPDSRVGIAVYGVTRLTAPWVLNPTEMLDGAVSQATIHLTSWPLLNNPVVLELARRHGRDLNFLAVLVHRSNWGGQAEMELIADRDAQAASLLGARAAIVTTNIRGRRFVDTIACVKACEREGIAAILLTEEEDTEDAAATPLLINDPAIVSSVSTGNGAVAGPFPPVARIVGARGTVDPAWFGALLPIRGRYGAFHLQDYFGLGRQSCASY